MTITPVRMPKWGLSMQEGVIVDWLKPEGAEVAAGEELVEIETAKIVNVAESPAAGVLRRVLASAGETLQTIQVGERMIRYGRAGPSSGTAAVLIHGFAADLNGWLFNLEALAADRPVYALDLPGHGGSTKDVGDGGLAALAEVVEGWLSALGVDRAHLVGHSLGAAVAARFALDHPDRVASLALVAPAYLGGAVNADFLTGVVQARRARDLKPWLEMLTADSALITRDMVEDVLKAKRLDGVDEALGTLRDRLVDGADAAALRADLPRIPAALVVTSAADRIVGRADEAALPQSWRVVEVAGAGHLPHLEQAVQVNAELRAWMTERG
jgi:pyruvate dehydrogenase E2 component (dihydrolipoamide acetyltransferase)